MNPLMAATLGAVAGLGLLLIVNGVRGRPVLPTRSRVFGRRVSQETVLAVSLVALLVGIGVLTLTGWPVAAFGAAVATLAIPRSFGARQEQRRYITRTNAIAAWSELVRDNMAGAAGLEQALQAGVTVAPPAIAPELQRFSINLERGSLIDALGTLGRDLDHPSGDLVVAALISAARGEARELGPLLGRLASATRADSRMRERVEVGRARIRTSARIVVITTALTIAFLWVFARDLLGAYNTVAGQLWLCVVAAIFVIGGWTLRRFAGFHMPDRFQSRRHDPAAVPTMEWS